MLHDGRTVAPASEGLVLGHCLQTLLTKCAHAMPTGDELVRASMERWSRIPTSLDGGLLREVH
jgi:hypothetical protein